MEKKTYTICDCSFETRIRRGVISVSAGDSMVDGTPRTLETYDTWDAAMAAFKDRYTETQVSVYDSFYGGKLVVFREFFVEEELWDLADGDDAPDIDQSTVLYFSKMPGRFRLDKWAELVYNGYNLYEPEDIVENEED